MYHNLHGMKYCVQKNESLISFSFLRDSRSKLGPVVTKSSRFSPTFYSNIISPCPQDVSNLHLATNNTLIYIVGLYSTKKYTTMTLLMVILSPYHGPELRVHFVYHRIFQFFAKPFPVILVKFEYRTMDPLCLFYE